MFENLNFTERNNRNIRHFYDIKTHEEREIEYERLNQYLNEILYQLVLLRHSDEMIYDDNDKHKESKDLEIQNNVAGGYDNYYEHEPYDFENNLNQFNEDGVERNENHVFDESSEKHQAYPIIEQYKPYQVHILVDCFLFLKKKVEGKKGIF